jgi:hypothetical protein
MGAARRIVRSHRIQKFRRWVPRPRIVTDDVEASDLPVRVRPKKSLLDIPWFDEDQHNEKAKYSELMGGYFCLNFVCYE